MIYIQSNNEKTLPHHFDCACGLYGAMDLGVDYKLVTFDEVSSGKFDALIKRNLFIGSVEFMNEVFFRVGKKVNAIENTTRPFQVTSLGDALSRGKAGERMFIKPKEIKLFTGFVLDGFNYPSIESLPQDTEVFVYDEFGRSILSEWRIYVHKDEIIDVRNYSGDVMTFPNFNFVSSIIHDYGENLPVSYTIDVGILTYTQENVVIEFNDMWAIGNYGIPNDLYVKLLRSRYEQIMT